MHIKRNIEEQSNMDYESGYHDLLFSASVSSKETEKKQRSLDPKKFEAILYPRSTSKLDDKQSTNKLTGNVATTEGYIETKVVKPQLNNEVIEIANFKDLKKPSKRSTSFFNMIPGRLTPKDHLGVKKINSIHRKESSTPKSDEESTPRIDLAKVERPIGCYSYIVDEANYKFQDDEFIESKSSKYGERDLRAKNKGNDNNKSFEEVKICNVESILSDNKESICLINKVNNKTKSTILNKDFDNKEEKIQDEKSKHIDKNKMMLSTNMSGILKSKEFISKKSSSYRNIKENNNSMYKNKEEKKDQLNLKMSLDTNAMEQSFREIPKNKQIQEQQSFEIMKQLKKMPKEFRSKVLPDRKSVV